MTNEMKLLQELCKALGFHVETIIDRKERKEVFENAIRYNDPLNRQGRQLKSSEPDGMLDIDKDGMYTSYLINPIISYKLTKTEPEKKDD